MKFDFDSRTPGIRTLPSGSFTVSNTAHSCAWRGLAASNEMAPGRSEEDDIDDVGERHIHLVRRFVIAPAQVHPHLLGRDIPHRVVERLDMQPRLPAELLERQIDELDVAAHPEVGTIELQDEAGAGDRLVLRIASRPRSRRDIPRASCNSRCERRATPRPETRRS